MPIIDFDQVPEGETYSPVPPGEYFCRIVEVLATTSSEGHERWRLKVQIMEGEQSGRTFLDFLTFSTKGVKRVKQVLRGLGVAVVGQVDVTPSVIEGVECFVCVTVDTYPDRANGQRRPVNQVAYDGYRANAVDFP